MRLAKRLCDQLYRWRQPIVLRKLSRLPPHPGDQFIRDFCEAGIDVLELAEVRGYWRMELGLLLGKASRSLLAPYHVATSTPCTGVAASWCPNCGACSCVRGREGEFIDGLEDPSCPLHHPGSDHDSGRLGREE